MKRAGRQLMLVGAFGLGSSLGCAGASQSELCTSSGACSVDGVAGECVDGFCSIPTDQCPSGEWVEGPNQGDCVGTAQDGGDATTTDEESETQADTSDGESESESETQGGLDDVGGEDCEFPEVIDGSTITQIASLDIGEPVEFLAAAQTRPHANPYFMVGTGSDVSLFRILDGSSVAQIAMAQGAAGPYIDVTAEVLGDDDQPSFVYLTEDAAYLRRQQDDWDERTIAPQAGTPVAAALLGNGPALFLGTDLPAVNFFRLDGDTPEFVDSSTDFGPIAYIDNPRFDAFDFVGIGQTLAEDLYFSPGNAETFPAPNFSKVYERQYTGLIGLGPSAVTALHIGEDGALEAQFDFDATPVPVTDLPVSVDAAVAIAKLSGPGDDPIFLVILDDSEGAARVISVTTDPDSPQAAEHGVLCADGHVTALSSMRSATRGYVAIGTDSGTITVYSIL